MKNNTNNLSISKNISQTEELIWVIFGKLQQLDVADEEEDKITFIIEHYKHDPEYSDKEALEDAQLILDQVEAKITI